MLRVLEGFKFIPVFTFSSFKLTIRGKVFGGAEIFKTKTDNFHYQHKMFGEFDPVLKAISGHLLLADKHDFTGRKLTFLLSLRKNV